MATTTTPVMQRLANDNVSGGGFYDSGEGNLLLPSPRARTSKTGIWLAFCAISMTFAAFSSALLVRKGSTDWDHIELPWLLYVNTMVLVASSVAFEIARRRTTVFMRTAGSSNTSSMRWMAVTLSLGLLFVAGQLLVWHRLVLSGLYISTNPNSSFLYLFTAAHAVHVVGGLIGILIVMYRLSGPVPSLRKSTLMATTYYWHFMGVLWIYLLLFLFTQL